MPPLTEGGVWNVLAEIPDPEIPVVTLVEMGMIGGVEISGEDVLVRLRPTFSGCPALHVMESEIRRRVGALGTGRVSVEIVWSPPWSTDDIAPEARTKLAAFGLAPAPSPIISLEAILEAPRACPRCGSVDTEVRNEFGTTPCRTIHFCRGCRQPFEGMKPL